MQKVKKLTALVLAMMMALSIMAVTASARGEADHVHTEVCSEGTIMPRRPIMDCPYCGNLMRDMGNTSYNGRPCIAFKCKTPGCSFYDQYIYLPY